MWDSATISSVFLDLAFPVLEGSSMHHKILIRETNDFGVQAPWVPYEDKEVLYSERTALSG